MVVHAPAGTRMPLEESSRFGERETYFWPATRWRAIPQLGRIHYKKALPELPPHSHDNAFELCFLREGALNWDLDGQPTRLMAGELLVVAPSKEHGGAWSMMQPCRLDFLQINSGVGGSVGRMVGALRKLSGKPRMAGPDVASAFDQILSEARRGDVWATEAMQAAVTILLAAALRRASVQDRYSEPVNRVVCHIDAYPEHWPTVSELARIAGLGATQLQLRFKRETGLSINRYAMEQKLARAKKLLAAGESCTTTAVSLGFSSSQYFATAFKRLFGVSPRALSRQNNNVFPLSVPITGRGRR